MMGMEGAFLEEVGAVPKADTLRRKEVQLNTRMHFTQRRCADLPDRPISRGAAHVPGHLRVTSGAGLGRCRAYCSWVHVPHIVPCWMMP